MHSIFIPAFTFCIIAIINFVGSPGGGMDRGSHSYDYGYLKSTPFTGRKVKFPDVSGQG